MISATGATIRTLPGLCIQREDLAVCSIDVLYDPDSPENRCPAKAAILLPPGDRVLADAWRAFAEMLL